MLRAILTALLVVSSAFLIEVSISSPAEAKRLTTTYGASAYRNVNRQRMDLAKQAQRTQRAMAVQRLNTAINKARTASRLKAEEATRKAAERAKTVRDREDKKRREAVNGVFLSRLIARGGTIRSATSPYRAGPVAVQRTALSPERKTQLQSTVSRLPLTVLPPRPKVAQTTPPKRPAFIGHKKNTRQAALPKAVGKSLQTAGRSKTCSFHGDTLVMTDTGMVPIRDILVGEHRVWARDEYTGETGWKDVLAHYSNEYDETVYVSILDPDTGQTQTIISNRIHPFFGRAPEDQGSLLMINHDQEPLYVFEGEWIEAANLERGTLLLSSDGTWDELVGVVPATQDLTAFNLTVEGFHTFFVSGSTGESSIWVHNDCVVQLPESAKEAANRLGIDALSIKSTNGVATAQINITQSLKREDLSLIRLALREKGIRSLEISSGYVVNPDLDAVLSRAVGRGPQSYLAGGTVRRADNNNHSDYTIFYEIE